MNIVISWLQLMLQKKTFYRHVLVLITGTSFAQSLAVIASPLLTRLYNPEEFGLLAVYISILSIFVLFGSLQYENAIPLPKDNKVAANLLVLCFIILIGICFLSCISLWIVKKQLLRLLHARGLERYIWLLPFSLLGNGTYNILNYWVIRKKAFIQIATTKISQSLGMIGTQIIVGLLKQGPLGLLLGDSIGRMGGSGRLTYLILREDRKVLSKVTTGGIRQAASRFKKFPLISSGSALLKELSIQFPAVLLAVACGPQIVGWFMLVQRVLGMPLSLIGYSVSNVYMAEASTLMRQQPGGIFKLYWQTLKHLFVIIIPFITFLSLFAPKIFPFVFGQEWREAGIYLQILSPMYLFQFLSTPVSPTVYVLERQDLQLVREAIRFGLFSLVWVVAITARLKPLPIIILLSISGSLGFIIHGAISWLAIKKYYKRGSTEN